MVFLNSQNELNLPNLSFSNKNVFYILGQFRNPTVGDNTTYVFIPSLEIFTLSPVRLQGNAGESENSNKINKKIIK